jgi:hypothetical protein
MRTRALVVVTMLARASLVACAAKCKEVKELYTENSCCGFPDKAVVEDKNSILKPPTSLAQCAPFAEYEVPLRLGAQPVKCQVLPPNYDETPRLCYDPAKYWFGTKVSQCEAQKAKYGKHLYAANAGQSYPTRDSLTDATLNQLCKATTCISGFDGPLLDPVVFEHLVEISYNCLLTPVQVSTLEDLGNDWEADYNNLMGIDFTIARNEGSREYRGGNPLYQMLANRQSLVENKQHNQIPMYTYFQPIYTTITFEFIGAQGYQEALLMYKDYLQYDETNPVTLGFTEAEVDDLRGKLTSTILWAKLQKEKVERCYPMESAITLGANGVKPHKLYDITPTSSTDEEKYLCAYEPRGTEAQILQAIRGLVAVETNLQLFGGTDTQSFVPAERLPRLGDIISDTRALCDGTLPTESWNAFLGFEDVCLLKTAFCPFDQQADFSGLSNRQILSVYESAYFAGSDKWRGFFNRNAMQAFNQPQDSIFYPENHVLLTDDDVENHATLVPCPPRSNGATCSLNWRRNKVVMTNALETGVFGYPPLRQRINPNDPSSEWLRMPNSSNFLFNLPPPPAVRPLSLAEYCTALAENRFKGTVRGQDGSKINREDNTLCNYRAALLVDVKQDLNVNTFMNYLSDVNTRPGGAASSVPYSAGAFASAASGGGMPPGAPSSAPGGSAPSSGGGDFASNGS